MSLFFILVIIAFYPTRTDHLACVPAPSGTQAKHSSWFPQPGDRICRCTCARGFLSGGKPPWRARRAFWGALVRFWSC